MISGVSNQRDFTKDNSNVKNMISLKSNKSIFTVPKLKMNLGKVYIKIELKAAFELSLY